VLKIPIKTIEEQLNITLKTDHVAAGIDTASRTGICVAKTDKSDVYLEYSFLDMKSSNKYHKYNTLIDYMKNFVDNNKIDTIVVEETFFSTNAKVFQFLSRIGGMVYTVAHLKKVKEKLFISAVQARKALSLPCIKKKAVVHEEFHRLIPNITITDIDIIDAIVLAINGLIKPDSLI
jgi:Holliday junction resolvasome RuvABC endonuclease subunit